MRSRFSVLVARRVYRKIGDYILKHENIENYNKNIIVGKKTIKPRMTKVPTIIPVSYTHLTLPTTPYV